MLSPWQSCITHSIKEDSMSGLRIGILTGLYTILTAGLAMADPSFPTPVGPPFTPPGLVRAVPIPSTEVFFGLGFAALVWIGPKIRKRRYSSVA
jgi:hypothetical protein